MLFVSYAILQVNIGKKKYNIDTPIRKVAVKRYTRKSYPSFCKTIVKSQPKAMVHALCNEIRQELSQMCSTDHNSVLMNDGESISFFLGILLVLNLNSRCQHFRRCLMD